MTTKGKTLIKKIDHIVITTAVPEACLNFYEKLGFEVRDVGGRYELFAGDFKINVHIKGRELLPHAGYVQTGSADLCFEIDEDPEKFRKEVEQLGLSTETEVVDRHGANGEMKSVYLRDPDENLVEFCFYKR